MELNVNFDIPDPKKKLFKESWELFRRASNLQDAVHQMEVGTWLMKNEKMKLFYNAAIMELSRQRDELLERAIEKHMQYKNYGV